MKKSFKKKLFAGILLGTSVLTLTACGSKKESSTDGNKSNEIKGDVKLWVDTEQMSVYKNAVKDFNEKYPDVKVTIATGKSADAKADVSKDPEKAADVFMLPHDQVGQMAEAGLLYPNTKFEKEIKANNTEAAVQGASWKDKLYGYPYGVESQVLYYNKAKLTADDVKTWESLTTKGKLGANFADKGANYIFAPLFMTNGDVLYGKSGEDAKGTDFNNDKGVEVLKWIAKQKDNQGVVQSSESALSNLQSGKTDAFLSGPWSKNDVKKALGDNMAVAAYPSVDFGSGAKDMKAFLGVKLFAVNQQTKAPLAAMELANYLTSEKVQLANFEENGIIPSNSKLKDNDKVTTDELAKAVMQMATPERSVVMPKLPEIVSFWPPMDAIINDTFKGQIKEDQYKEKLEKFVTDISKVEKK